MNREMVHNNVIRFMNFIGVLLMVAVIAATIPLTVPKLFGAQIFSVLTGSMEPVYPVGSVIYVQEVLPEEVAVGDAITYLLGEGAGYVMTHRVIGVLDAEQALVMQGDANDVGDDGAVSF